MILAPEYCLFPIDFGLKTDVSGRVVYATNEVHQRYKTRTRPYHMIATQKKLAPATP